MSSESFTSAKVNNEELDKDTPLSDEEISRLIQASRETHLKEQQLRKIWLKSLKRFLCMILQKNIAKIFFQKRN